MIKYYSGKCRCVMAIGTILAVRVGRYVINELAYTDHVVVA